MLPRQAVLLTPPISFYPKPLLSRRHPAPVSPLAATLMDSPASAADKRLTAGLSPLDATLTKNRGVEAPRHTHASNPDLTRAQSKAPPRLLRAASGAVAAKGAQQAKEVFHKELTTND